MLLKHNNAFDKGERVVEVSFQHTNCSSNVAQDIAINSNIIQIHQFLFFILFLSERQDQKMCLKL
jgi:hypothetical protein